MEEYKRLLEWQEAWRAGYAIHLLTQGRTDVLSKALRHVGALLPCEIAEATFCNQANRAAELRSAFHRGLDFEFLLYLAVEDGLLRYADGLPIFCRLQVVNRRLFTAASNEAGNG
jgi:hypothetical protein